MSDIATILSAYARIGSACRGRPTPGPEGGPTLTDHQARILRHLDVTDPVMVTELAEYLGVTASTTSLNLKRLEAGGFITRGRDPDDRRVMNVRLTESGDRVRQRTSELDPDLIDAMLMRVRPERRPAAVEGLVLLAEAADALVARRADYVDSFTGRGDP